jgi:hypothetical protein
MDQLEMMAVMLALVMEMKEQVEVDLGQVELKEV